MREHTRRLTITLAAATALATLGTAAPALASGGDDVVRRGSCTRSTDWKVKVGPDDGRLEVEGEIDSNRNGQSWSWRIVHNGSVSAHGTRVTRAPSGSFEVRRMLVNLRGTDTVTFRARNPRSGEVCRGTVRL
jgi:hypothetical protein